jgi:hypothetical protein
VPAVADFIHVRIEGTGRNFMQKRLPDVGAIAIDEDNVVVFAPITGAKPASKFKPAGTTTDDYDLCFLLQDSSSGLLAIDEG